MSHRGKMTRFPTNRKEPADEAGSFLFGSKLSRGHIAPQADKVA